MRSNPPQALSADAAGVAIIGPAVADPKLPYRSYPNLMLSIKGRGGAYAYVAIVSLLTSRSGAFSYDPSMAIALLAACLGCAAVFSRSLFVAAVFSGALLTSLWYDCGHAGFLGKLIGYPAILFIFGLVVRFCKAEISPPGFLAIFILAAGASLSHNGQAFALLYGVLAVPLLAGLVLFGHPHRKILDLAGLVAMPAVAAVVASGTLARPFRSANAYPQFNFDWSQIVVVLADLNNFLKDVSPLSGAGLWTIWIASLAICIALAAYAVARRNASALALIVGPTLLVGALGLAGARAVAIQLVGLPYPAMLCGAMLLAQETGIGRGGSPITSSKEFLNTPPSRRRHYFTNAIRSYISPAALAIALVATHVPRLVGSVQHFAFNADFRQRLAMSDFDRLAGAVGGQQLYVDIKGSLWSVFPVLIELGRRDMHLVWGPEAWKTAIGSLRGWPPPAVEHLPSLRLIDVTEPVGPQERILIETPRYKLLARVDATSESR
jgi:hypothetical protein